MTNIIWYSSTETNGTPKKINSVRISGTELTVTKTNSFANNIDTAQIKISVKDRYGNLITDSVTIHLITSRSNVDTLSGEYFYFNGASETYCAIISVAGGTSVISADTPNGISDTALINFISNAIDTIILVKPLNNTDTKESSIFFSWKIPASIFNDSIHFIVQISSDSLFNIISDSNNSAIDQSKFQICKNGVWSFFPAAGINNYYDSVGYSSPFNFTGDFFYWQASAFDNFTMGGTSTINSFNMIPSISLSTTIETVSLNGITYNETGIIPGVSIFINISAVNNGADTADNIVIKFQIPEHTVFAETYFIDNNCIQEWSTDITPSQSYNSVNYTTSPPSPAQLTKWFRIKKSSLGVNESIRNVIRLYAQ